MVMIISLVTMFLLVVRYNLTRKSHIYQVYFGWNKCGTPYDSSLLAKVTLVNGDKRGTIRMPLETKHEFDALLEISEYQYAYELLGEMHNLYMEKLSPEQLRLFHAQLENIKRKAALKEAKKQQKK
ncbi:hypothetical protein [Bacillus cereus group sp. BfR-BA-01311]|uniref:hypothetical protein n=1 Tax=Bacillus cereus group sp. BfR-BA-01311 TaxID=2920288 RepID=UPI001F5A3594